MRYPWLSTAAALLISTSGAGMAQERVITGNVTDSATGEPVPNADIQVKGTLTRVQARASGQFTLNQAPQGDFTLVVRAIGFHRRELAIAGGQNVVTVALGRDVFRLEEVVITGQATGVEKQNLPMAVATVTGDELGRAPTGTLESALQGKVPGATIQANSGAPGGGIQLNLRGVSTTLSSSSATSSSTPCPSASSSVPTSSGASGW
jgi:outer membrane receptor protein involved in Fe transport